MPSVFKRRVRRKIQRKYSDSRSELDFQVLQKVSKQFIFSTADGCSSNDVVHSLYDLTNGL